MTAEGDDRKTGPAHPADGEAAPERGPMFAAPSDWLKAED